MYLFSNRNGLGNNYSLLSNKYTQIIHDDLIYTPIKKNSFGEMLISPKENV